MWQLRSVWAALEKKTVHFQSQIGRNYMTIILSISTQYNGIFCTRWVFVIKSTGEFMFCIEALRIEISVKRSGTHVLGSCVLVCWECTKLKTQNGCLVTRGSDEIDTGSRTRNDGRYVQQVKKYFVFKQCLFVNFSSSLSLRTGLWNIFPVNLTVFTKVVSFHCTQFS